MTVKESNLDQALLRITSAIRDLACMIPTDGDAWLEERLSMIVESMHDADKWYRGDIDG